MPVRRHEPLRPRRRASVAAIALAVSAAGALACGACSAGTPPPNSTPASQLELTPLTEPPLDAPIAIVTAVLDGDTIQVDLGANLETVRLLGIDTPEKLGGPRPAECHGAEATSFTTELLPVGSEVLLARDIQARDQYGRLLAYVFRAGDNLFVNHALVAFGHATASFYEPNSTFRQPFTRAALIAERDVLGFWASCGGAAVLLAATDS